MKYYSLDNSIVIKDGDSVRVVSKDDYRYQRIKDALANQDFDKVRESIDPTKNLDKEGFIVKDGLVYHSGNAIPSVLGNQFLAFKSNNWVFKSLFNFWFNLKNRVDDATAAEMINALVDFGAYPLTEDGFYLVYRNSATDQTRSILNKKRQENGGINFYNIANCPQEYSQFFVERKSLEDILNLTFGFTAKKLRKLAIQSVFNENENFLNFKFFLIGEAFKDVLHPDNFYDVIENKLLNTAHLDVDSHRKFNLFIKDYTIEKNGSYNQKKTLNLLKSAEKNRDILINIAAYYCELKEKINLDLRIIELVNDAQVIFEYLRKEHRKLEDPEIDLKVQSNYPEYYQLHDIEVGKFRFLMPKTNYDLREWTNIMQNCIHSYHKRVLDKSCIVFALLDKDSNEMVYNIEISRNTVVQFNGRGNRAAKNEDKREVCKFLKDRGLIFKE